MIYDVIAHKSVISVCAINLIGCSALVLLLFEQCCCRCINSSILIFPVWKITAITCKPPVSVWYWGLVGCLPRAWACSAVCSIELLVSVGTLLLLYRARFWACSLCLWGQAVVVHCLVLFPYYLSSPLVQFLPLFVGENVVRGDKDSIRNLLEIFDGLLEYLTEQLSEEEELPNGGEHGGYVMLRCFIF